MYKHQCLCYNNIKFTRHTGEILAPTMDLLSGYGSDASDADAEADVGVPNAVPGHSGGLSFCSDFVLEHQSNLLRLQHWVPTQHAN